MAHCCIIIDAVAALEHSGFVEFGIEPNLPRQHLQKLFPVMAGPNHPSP
jgi:hypothetical protein